MYWTILVLAPDYHKVNKRLFYVHSEFAKGIALQLGAYIGLAILGFLNPVTIIAVIAASVIRGGLKAVSYTHLSEFGFLVEALGGEVIRVSASSDTHLNAMDMDKAYGCLLYTSRCV